MENWQWREIGSFVKLTKGISYKSEDYGDEQNGAIFITLKCFSKGGGFNQSGIKYYKGALAPEYLLQEGDLLIANTDLTRDGDVIGSPLLLPLLDNRKEVVMSMDISRLDFTSEETDKKYIYYTLSLPSARKFMQENSSGSTVLHLKTKNVPKLKVWLPADKEIQITISKILTSIDRAIAQTEALIAKHQRIKTGLMQDLLTRGIDEHGQLRDPSTHRFKSTPLGMIPEEWEVSNIGKISHRVTSGSRWWARYYSDTGAKFIRIGNLTREHVNLRLQNIQHVQPPDSSEAKRTVLETGDLLISVTADLGIIGIVPSDLGEAYINQHIALVKLDKEKINPYFIGNLLSGFQAQKYFSLLNDSGAKAGLNLKAISAFPVVFPSDKKEQDRMAEIIQKTDGIIETQKSKRKKFLGLKAGLMRDLLSGRVSVRLLMEG